MSDADLRRGVRALLSGALSELEADQLQALARALERERARRWIDDRATLSQLSERLPAEARARLEALLSARAEIPELADLLAPAPRELVTAAGYDANDLLEGYFALRELGIDDPRWRALLLLEKPRTLATREGIPQFRLFQERRDLECAHLAALRLGAWLDETQAPAD